jgi:predicted O-methyltransferase YrrM
LYSSFTIVRKYVQYWLTASNRKGHGVHSPFVYDFVKHVLNDSSGHPIYKEIEQLRKNLLKNKSIITVEDFGAGSTIIPTSKRRVDAIAKSSLKSKKYAQLLYRIASYFKTDFILELGTSLGITTSYLANSSNSVKVKTMEGSEVIATIARENFSSLKLNNIEVIVGDFNKTLPQYLTENPIIQLAFIDGNHRKEPTIHYFNQINQHINESTIIIFDDIHWSAEMESAWEEIKNHPSVTLSIDLFFIGLVFFKKDFKVKQHFSIQF